MKDILSISSCLDNFLSLLFVTVRCSVAVNKINVKVKSYTNIRLSGNIFLV